MFKEMLVKGSIMVGGLIITQMAIERYEQASLKRGASKKVKSGKKVEDTSKVENKQETV